MLLVRNPIMASLHEQELETLTQQAVNAAKAGKWDHVTTLYERRGQLLSISDVSPSLAERLVKWDTVVQAQVSLVQAATRQNILEIQERRRKLHHLKQGWLPSSGQSSRFSRAV